jgi:alpha-tubulin suppressor-like RCC1 family protein
MLANPLQLAGGNDTACARLVGGALRCWGVNDRGQLGDGTTTNRLIPTLAATSVSGPLTIATASKHTCAIDAASALWCWGANGDGQLGDGTLTTHPTPVMVQGLPSLVSDVAVGEQHTCAIVANGDVWCWGDNRIGQLGSDANIREKLPVLVPGAGPAMRVFSRGSFTCALGTDAALRCWGRNDGGQAGADTSAHTSPTSVRCGP